MTKVCIVKAMVFPVVVYGCESWIIKKAEHWKIDTSELWCWRRFLRVLWTARRSHQSILKEINPEYSLEGLMLKLKLQSFGHLTHWKRPWCWERLKAVGEGDARGWDVWMASLGHEIEQAPGVGDGQGGLVCCSPWGCKQLDKAEQLNWTQQNTIIFANWNNFLFRLMKHHFFHTFKYTNICSYIINNISYILPK